MSHDFAESCNWTGEVIKKAFKTQAGSTWSKRTLEFSGTEFKLTWKKNGVAKDTFVLNPLEVDFGPCEEHHRPFEIKVTSPRDGNKMSLYFCPETADDQNVLITRMDAARRLKVASVSTSGTVFSDERSTLQMALTSPAGPESGAKAFSWGLGSLLGVAFKSKMDGMSIPHRIAALTPSPSGTLSLHCGPEHAAALTSDSGPHLWGSNEFFQLGNKGSDSSSTPLPSPLPFLSTRRVHAMACGGSHTLVLASAPSSPPGVFAWGTGSVGQLGLQRSLQQCQQPTPLPLPAAAAGAHPVSVHAGLVSSAAILADGSVHVWGDASGGRLGLPDVPLRPSSVASPRPYVNDHVVWAPTPLPIPQAVLGAGPGSVVRVAGCALGGSFTLLLVHVTPPGGGVGAFSGGVLLVCGCLGVDVTRDTYGYPPKPAGAMEALLETESRVVIPAMTPETVHPFGVKPCVLAVSAGARHAAVIAALAAPGEGGSSSSLGGGGGAAAAPPRLFTAGKGWLGHASEHLPPAAAGAASAHGSGHPPPATHGAAGHAVASGHGSDGSILITPPSTSPHFHRVAGALEALDVLEASCGHSHTLVRAAGGQLWSWGRGDSGELGQGSLSDRTMPAAVRNCVPGHVWSSVSAGSYYSAAVAVAGESEEGRRVAAAVGGGGAGAHLREAVARVLAAQGAAVGVAGGQVWSGAARAGSSSSMAAAATAASASASASSSAASGAPSRFAALALEVARSRWEDGGGELPPGWDYDTTDDGEYYYLEPDVLAADGSVLQEGGSVWEDPRVDFNVYVSEYVKAAERGVDLLRL